MTNQFNVGTLTDLVHSAAVNFDGSQPEGAVSTTPGRIVWAAGVHQGLISPAQLGITTPLRVVRLQLFMAGQDSWVLALLDGANSVVLAQGLTDTSFIDEGTALLNGGQQLQLTTLGAGTSAVKMVCTVIDAYAYSPAPRGI